MCRWLAYCGDPIFLDSLLFDTENSLIEQSLHARKSVSAINGDGFGVGWYGDRQTPGLFRDILPAWNDSNLKSMAHQIKSGLFFAHVRASTGTPVSRENCHPFVYKNWLFMHNGQIGNYRDVRHGLEMTLDANLFAHRLGATDSELLFLLLIQNGLEQDPIEALRKTLHQTINMMEQVKAEHPLRFTACLSNGQDIYALRFSSDPQAPSLFTCTQNGATLIASEPLSNDGVNWCSLDQGTLLHATRDGVKSHSFDLY
ncbi:class II glutamine amidotransferase [Terasakiella sp.]|uniref:class II glutamine amidotransferase n=1 Tax=Terasakiella sp. TaxID=2034861 RepID=UPI003AA7CE3B